MVNVVVMGECMIEFSPAGNSCYKQAFAGDIYNTAVYLKRLQNSAVDISILTAVGCDALSNAMVDDFKASGIDTSFVQRVSHRQTGAYLIEISAEGERSFVYWRDTSAAKLTISQLEDNAKRALIDQCDVFYFSGISIAILAKEDRQAFWLFLAELKQAGVRIVFDSNFRSRLWESKADAISQFDQALSISDLVFAGVEDFNLLYDLNSFSDVDNFLNEFAINELIIKNGPDDIFYRSTIEQFEVEISPVECVVDSTSAGDSFNSGYLSARMNGSSSKEAIEHACRVSACVIQHKGAVINQDVFSAFMAKE
ncbi:sugar kinase [Colwellia psychrerythraea]|uniref:2-dehydro-3-deoxygluconokinase n=1 Tax=Colwellia psychrerythraea TaxID=28229 RepID=A0A099KD90_COLPS|nr:sugar kinase [Colwellia psychrerythraea]KGJ88290.1 2-dehydro-3-deoxygluconokinase [Colwellia psychrerythraea]